MAVVETTFVSTYALYPAPFTTSFRATYDLNYSEQTTDIGRIKSIIYKCYIGSLTVPIQSFQLRKVLNDGGLTERGYATVVVPAYGSFESDLLANLSTIQVDSITTYTDGTTQTDTIFSVSFTEYQINEGINNKTISISGETASSAITQDVYVPVGVRSFGGNGVDSFRMRCNYQLGITTGMSLSYKGNFYLISELTYNFGVSSADLDISMVV